jgi:hypothetical protein
MHAACARFKGGRSTVATPTYGGYLSQVHTHYPKYAGVNNSPFMLGTGPFGGLATFTARPQGLLTHLDYFR